jgi:hypothetical protein
MSAAEFSWRPLGTLFVEQGLLREEDLEHALAVQAETGGQLGERLVELGYVSSTALARLLAEQYGVELKLDTGFGTGLWAELERRRNPAKLELVPDIPEPEPVEPQPLAGLEEQWAKLAAAEARVAELEEELAATRKRAERAEARLSRRA